MPMKKEATFLAPKTSTFHPFVGSVNARVDLLSYWPADDGVDASLIGYFLLPDMTFG